MSCTCCENGTRRAAAFRGRARRRCRVADKARQSAVGGWVNHDAGRVRLGDRDCAVDECLLSSSGGGLLFRAAGRSRWIDRNDGHGNLNYRDESCGYRDNLRGSGTLGRAIGHGSGA